MLFFRALLMLVTYDVLCTSRLSGGSTRWSSAGGWHAGFG